ncbi:MAG TPA: hypothetical protein VMZ66_03440 [Aeromicrobium sp.]|nr:hypothetical protein [Aeromicrobium sp.]
MLGFVTLVVWATTIIVGLRMHGVKRMPVGIVLPHAALALTGIVVWIAYLASDRPATLGWLAVAWAVLVNALGDAANVRRWKKKADGGLGLIGTYVQRVKARRILLVHLSLAGTTTVLALLTVLAA